MDADGRNVRNLTNNAAADVEASWSPDGQSIAFRSDRDGNWEIYVMDADGSNQLNLTNDPSGDFSPSWSPDSGRIVFTDQGDLWTAEQGSSERKRVTSDRDDERRPVFSPDGATIAFTPPEAAFRISGSFRRAGTNRRSD